MHPYFLTGFADGESTFAIRLKKNNKMKIGWRIEAGFFIHLHGKDKILFQTIQSYFGVGTIHISQRDGTVMYYVNSLKEIINYPAFWEVSIINTKKGGLRTFKTSCWTYETRRASYSRRFTKNC